MTHTVYEGFLTGQGEADIARLSANEIGGYGVMLLKWSLILGVPSLVTYLASSYSKFLDNIVFIVAPSIAALLVAIIPRLSDKD
jgi:hypothetical protein